MADGSTLVRQLLERSHLFKTLDEGGRNELEALGKAMAYPAGTTIIEENTEGDSFYILIKGSVKVSAAKDGKTVNLANLGRGAVLGEVALLTGEPRTATVTTTEDSTLVKFQEPGITEILNRYPKVKELLVRVLVHRAKDTIEKLSGDLSVS